MTTTSIDSESDGGMILRAIADQIGYDEDQLARDAALEADLGVDSVILEGLLVELETRFGISRELDRDAATVGDLIDDVLDTEVSDRADTIGRATPGHVAGVASPAVPDWAIDVPGRNTKSAGQGTMKDFGPDGDTDLFAKTARFARHRRSRVADQLYWYGMPSSGRLHGRGVYLDTQTGRDREYLLFASNNYLGLANDPRVSEAIADATGVFGATNTGCRIIGGTTRLHLELERRLAEFKGRDACIVFPGGYSANVGTISALTGPADQILTDNLNHMSIVDGCTLSGAHRLSFQHNDMDALRARLQCVAERRGGTLVAVDGVFSMHGDICPLPELVQLTREHGARLLVDDAHSTGVLGRTGSGTAEHFGLKGNVDLELGTMSKALAGIGGFVVGDGEVVDYLRYYANSYVFAATTPAPVVAGMIAALDILQQEPELLQRLWRNIHRLRDRLLTNGFDLEHTQSAILPVVVGDEDMTLRLGREVRSRGMFCQTVVYPGVPLGQARLRISVTVEHTERDLDTAADIVRDAADAVGFRRGV